MKVLIKNNTNNLACTGGLVLGMAVAILIGIWVYNNSYFSHLIKINRYATEVTQKSLNQIESPETKLLTKKYKTLVRQVTTLFGNSNSSIERGVTRAAQSIEQSVTDMFSSTILTDSPPTNCNPCEIVNPYYEIQACFRVDPPINHIIKFNNKLPVTITALHTNLTPTR